MTTQAQDATTQVQSGPTPPDRVYATQAEFINAFIAKYTGRSSYNPDGKPLRQWNATDLTRLTTGELSTIRAIFIFENYDLVDRIKPDGMSRAEFSRSILRESSRRGEVMDYYERRLPFAVDTVTVARPQEAPAAQRVTVTESPALITARDAAVGILRNRNLGAITVQSDVATQTGIRPDPQGRPAGIGIQSDTSVYDLGYTMGAIPQNRANGSLPLSLLFDRTPAEISSAYCVATNDIYAQRGRTIDQQEAFSAGFAQGRSDTGANFDPAEARIGILGTVCPTNTPAVNDNTRLMLALRSSSDGRTAN